MSKKLFILGISFILLSRCRQQDTRFDKIQEVIATYKKNTNKTQQPKVYLFTALEGCGACVEATVKFIENNISNPSMLFIVAGTSQKELKIKFSAKTIKSSNFLMDNQLISLKNELITTIHPKVYCCRDRQVVMDKEINYVIADSVFKAVIDFAIAK